MSVQPSEVDMAIATPGDWLRVELARSDAEIAATVDERVAQLPELGAMRDQAVSLLRQVRDGSKAAGVALSAVMFDAPEGVPVTAGMTVSAVPLEDLKRDGEAPPDDLNALADAFRDSDDPLSRTREVAVVELPAGRAVRVQQFEEGDADRCGSAMVTFNVQYVIPLTGTGIVAVIAFSTPTVALADSFVPLFEGIASTFELRPADEPEPAR